MREVTKKDVEDAAMIAQLVGGAYTAGAPYECVDQEPRKLHDCPDCAHYEHFDECTHSDAFDCVAAAIGASDEAVDLWLETCCALVETAKDRKAELDYMRKAGTKHDLQDREQLYAWVDSLREGGIDHEHYGFDKLEAAAVLYDGHLPPGWKIVAKKRAKKRAKRAPAHRSKPVETGGLPTVRIVMTGRRPQVIR